MQPSSAQYFHSAVSERESALHLLWEQETPSFSPGHTSVQLYCLLLLCVAFYERDDTMVHTLQVPNNLREKASAAQEAWLPTQWPPQWE